MTRTQFLRFVSAGVAVSTAIAAEKKERFVLEVHRLI